MFTSSGKRLLQQKDGILIKGITEKDEGLYTCRARVAEFGEIKQKDIQVSILLLLNFLRNFD